MHIWLSHSCMHQKCLKILIGNYSTDSNGRGIWRRQANIWGPIHKVSSFILIRLSGDLGSNLFLMFINHFSYFIAHKSFLSSGNPVP